MTNKICRLEYDFNTNKIKSESAGSGILTLSQTIENDKRFGTFQPANGKYFTYKVLNEDVEFSKSQTKRAVQFAQRRWRIYAGMKPFRPAKAGEVIDFRIEFRDVATDPDKKLRDSTVMYHYYPISNVDNKFRGLCVVNKRFFFTSHGNAVSGKFMKDMGIPVQFENGQYETLDFDTVYAHELGHGLGLPHDTSSENIMSWRVDLMSEYPSMRDQVRMRAKYGTRLMSSWILRRWLDWLRYASDR